MQQQKFMKQNNNLHIQELTDQPFDQFDIEVYNHIAATKSPVLNNRFFVEAQPGSLMIAPPQQPFTNPVRYAS